MSDLVSRAIIPTNSLVLISDEVDDKLSSIIQYMKASSSIGHPSRKKNINKYINTSRTTRDQLSLTFNKKTSKEDLSICDMIEDAREAGFHDIWIHQLVLRIKYNRTVYDFCFKNAALTEGSQAASWIVRYLDSLKDGGWVKASQVRHLPLISVKTVPEGASMSPYDVSDPSFIAWLGGITHGLIRLKTVRRVDDTTYVDVAIKEMGA